MHHLPHRKKPVWENYQYADNFADDIARRITISEEKLEWLKAKSNAMDGKDLFLPVHSIEDLHENEKRWQDHISVVQELLVDWMQEMKHLTDLKTLQATPPPTIEGNYGFQIVEETDEYLLIEPKPE